MASFGIVTSVTPKADIAAWRLRLSLDPGSLIPGDAFCITVNPSKTLIAHLRSDTVAGRPSPGFDQKLYAQR